MSHQCFQELDRFFAVGLTGGPAQEGFLALVFQGSIQSGGINFFTPPLGHS
jgi:hypothetical protein